MVTSRAQDIEIKRIAAKYGFTSKQVHDMVQSQYDYINKTISETILPTDLTEEEFNKTTKNFNIPAIGKLYSSYKVYKLINKNATKRSKSNEASSPS